MKKILVVLLLALSVPAFSQVKIGFAFGLNGITDRDKVMYVENPVNIGGELGVNVSLPVLNSYLAIETGLLFYDIYYRLRGPYFKVWFSNDFGSGFSFNENMNDFGLNLPVSITWNKGKLRPFIGAGFQKSLSSNREGYDILGSMNAGNPVYFSGRGEDIIELSSFTWYLNGGISYVCSPKVKLNVQYSMGMNNFVTHTMSPKIVNDVNYGTTIQGSRINKFQLAMVYTPSWQKKVEKNHRGQEPKPKRTIKEKMKGLYQ